MTIPRTTPAALDLSALTVGGITPSWITVANSAVIMGVSTWTVRRWIDSGHLTARKLPSGGIRVSVASLEAIGSPVRPDAA